MVVGSPNEVEALEMIDWSTEIGMVEARVVVTEELEG